MKFTDINAMKVNDSYCYFLLRLRNGSGGESEVFGRTLFLCWGNVHFE